jgi:tetratricopeptide (TPR) repeat protein
MQDMVIDIRRLRKESSRISRKSIPTGQSGEPASAGTSANLSTSAQPDDVPEPQRSRPSTTVTLKIPNLTGRSTLAWLIPAFVVVAVIVGYLIFSGREDAAGERIPVAVADFNNQTKEEELDGLSGMLITSLEQSRHLSVLTRSRMFDVLKLMGKGNVDRIDEALGREISRQENVGALVVATISKFDQLYVIDMKVLDPEKNEYILTVKEQGEGKSSIPGIIDKLAEQTRLELKERKAEVDANTQKVAELTTPSMEAYQEYFSGEQLINKLRFKEAADHFKKAIAIDSSFGLAWYRLAYALAWSSSPGREEAIARALKVLDKVPEKERYFIRVMDALIREEPQHAIALLKELLRLYPEDKEATYLLGDETFHQGDYETAKSSLRKVIAMDPLNERARQHLHWALASSRSVDELKQAAEEYVKHVPSPTAYSLLSDAWVELAQYDSALQVCRIGIEKFPDNAFLKRQLGDIYVLAQSPEVAWAQYNRLIGRDRPFGERLQGFYGLVDLAISRGEYRKAVATVDDMLKLEPPASARRHLGTTLMFRAWKKVAYLRDLTGGRRDYERALEFEDAGAVEYAFFRYLYHMHAGEYQNARDVVNARLKAVSSSFIPFINGYEAMKSGNYGTALEYFMSQSHFQVNDPQIQYQRARVYISMGQFPAALSVLKDLRASVSVYASGGIYSDYVDMNPLSYYLEGTIYERTNDRAKAIKSYETFLSLWKNADKDIPQYVEAKERLAALR